MTTYFRSLTRKKVGEETIDSADDREMGVPGAVEQDEEDPLIPNEDLK